MLAFATASSGGEMRLCVDSNDWPPYTFARKEGISQVLVRMAAARHGNQVRFSAVPWRRCEKEVERGRFAGMLGATPTPRSLQHEAFPMKDGAFDESRALNTAEIILLHRAGSIVVWDGNTLRGLQGKVVYVLAYDEIEVRLAELGISGDGSLETNEQNAKAVLSGRTNVMATYRGDAVHLLANPEFAGKLEMIERPLGRYAYYLAFNKRFYQSDPDEVERLWDDIKAMRNDPAYLKAIDGLE